MKLSDKIALLRKQHGWSQEELARQLGISRQAVAKWESGQAIPALDKILVLSDLFEVSCDDLLKDDHRLGGNQAAPDSAGMNENCADRIVLDENHSARSHFARAQPDKQSGFQTQPEPEQKEKASTAQASQTQSEQNRTHSEGFHGEWKNKSTQPFLDAVQSGVSFAARKIADAAESLKAARTLREVDYEEIQNYLRAEKNNTDRISIGVALCIASPALLLFLCGINEMNPGWISENAASGFGICVLLAMVAAAVGLFIWSDNVEKEWKYIKKKKFVLSQAAENYVEEEKRGFQKQQGIMTAVGVGLCIVSVLPIFLSQMLENDFLASGSISLLLLLVSDGVFCLIQASYSETFDHLLKRTTSKVRKHKA